MSSTSLNYGSPAAAATVFPHRTCLGLARANVVGAARSRKRAFELRAVAETTGMEAVELKKGIAEFYDESSELWEDLWGDHMHHGFYDPKADDVSVSDHRAAQIRMIEEVLRFAGISEKKPIGKDKKVVDVGCGIGGSSRYLASKYGANCRGITLSPVQAQRANALAAAQGLANKASFQVADALAQPFPDGQFDLVWSMESGEHMPDKAKFVDELVRVAAPGATIIIVTWCHRDLDASAQSLKPDEKKLLDKASFQVADALAQPFPDGQFDLVWSMESGEHMPDKAKFVDELVRVAAPGATIIIVTWCHRDLDASAQSLKPDEKKLLDKASFQVADALAQPFPDGQFDLVWSMESGEHMPDKAKFVDELVRVAAPGATIIIVTWCHRDLDASAQSLKPDEKKLLDKICNAFYLPAWCSTADYLKLLESYSLEDIKAEDWSQYVAPFWPAVIRSVLTFKGFFSLLRTGTKTIKGALAMPLMIQGFKKDLIKFSIITCRKPE